MSILQETGFVWMALAENHRDDQEKAQTHRRLGDLYPAH